MGSEVDPTVENGRLVISPLLGGERLEDLLEGVTSENVHGETDTGPSVGAEIW